MGNTGFSSNTSIKNYKVEDEKNKLTIEEMNGYDMYKDIDQAWAERLGVPYEEKYIRGLPFGLKLSNGITVDRDTKLQYTLV
jgi:salicylate hydroxylase